MTPTLRDMVELERSLSLPHAPLILLAVAPAVVIGGALAGLLA